MNSTYTRKCFSLLLFLSVGMLTQVLAQEDRTGDIDQTLKPQQQPVREITREGDSYSFPEGSNDGRVSGGPTAGKDYTSKDTAAVYAPPKQTVANLTSKTLEKKEQKEDDSVLSFNFLYYIIQRFKLSDIIE